MWRIAVLTFLALTPALFGQTDIRTFTLTPMTLSFTAVDPDTGGPAPQSSTATVTWQGAWFRPWTLYVQAESSSLTNCGFIPASAVVARCTSATITGFWGLGSASCNSATIPVSTSPAVVASGTQGAFNNTVTVNVQTSFADSWRYRAVLAPACTVSLRYTVDAP